MRAKCKYNFRPVRDTNFRCSNRNKSAKNYKNKSALSDSKTKPAATVADAASNTGSAPNQNIVSMDIEKQPKINLVKNTPLKRGLPATSSDVHSKIPKTNMLQLSNRYDPLQHISEDVNSDPVTSASTNKQAPPKARRPAPIILDGKPKDSFKDLSNLLKEKCRGKFMIKFGPNTTAIHVETVADKTCVSEALSARKLPFWTYTNKEERSHAFVLHGLDCDIELSEIEQDLKQQLPDMIKMYKMNTKFRQLYLVITNNKIRLQDIQQKVSSICYCKVSWKRHVNKKELIQCHRCQKWGHATSNCNMPAKCLKCAQSHLTGECTKTRDTDATCANCDGKHPANSIECEVYQRRLRAKQARRPAVNKQPAVYIDAPQPTTNVWDIRRQQFQAQQSNLQQNQQISPRASGQQHESSTKAVISANQGARTLRSAQLNARYRPGPSHTETHTPLQEYVAPQTSGSTQAETGNISDLFTEMKKIHSVVNVTGLVLALKDLIARLLLARTPAEKVLTTLEFTEGVAKYNI